MATQCETYRDQTNIQTAEPIKYLSPMSPVKLSVLTQQITADLELSQKVWNILNIQMSELAETILKATLKNTYRKLASVLKQPPEKLPTLQKPLRK